MNTAIFEHWDAVEMFAQVICKYDSNYKIEDFNSTRILKKALNEFEEYDLCNKVTDKIFESLRSKTKSKSRGAKVFYNISRCVRHKEPLVMRERDVHVISRYIDSNTYTPKYNLLQKWIPQEKKRIYEGTIWSLYYFEEEQSFDTMFPTEGVVKSIIEFKPFSKVELESYSTKYKAPEYYEGKFDMFGNAEYLIMDLRTKTSNEKFLRIEMAIGAYAGIVELALGQYHNIDEMVYSNCFVAVQENCKREELKSDFFNPKIADQRRQIPDSVWKYCDGKELNRIRVKKGIFNFGEFDLWLNKKEQERARKKAILENNKIQQNLLGSSSSDIVV